MLWELETQELVRERSFDQESETDNMLANIQATQHDVLASTLDKFRIVLAILV